MRSKVVKKYIFLESVELVYSMDSIEYLETLRDALNIIIQQRRIGGNKPYREKYKGFVRL